ncbi:hypothetical protein BD309DRAFT_966178 [Dichomitus squalens]|nr:hypothetical protein BD309DRAFT_966178 [Dichomitus squalens]
MPLTKNHMDCEYAIQGDDRKDRITTCLVHANARHPDSSSRGWHPNLREGQSGITNVSQLCQWLNRTAPQPLLNSQPPSSPHLRGLSSSSRLHMDVVP